MSLRHATVLAPVLFLACGRAPSEQPDTHRPSALSAAAPNGAVDTQACNEAYEQTNAAIANMPADIDSGEFPPIERAPRDVFLRDCLRLPPVVQKCLVFAYMAEHTQECETARAEYDGNVRAEYDKSVQR